MEHKKCGKCGDTKLIGEFNKNKHSKDGHQAYCKSCYKLYMEIYRKTNRDSIILQSKLYREANRDEIRASQKEYYEANRDAVLSRKQSYSKLYYAANKASIGFRNRSYGKSYRKINSDKINAKTAIRRASKLQATPLWCNPAAVADFYVASKMFKLYTGDEYHVDHIVPLKSDVVCGLHCESNLQLLLSSDNLSKGNHHWPDMW